MITPKSQWHLIYLSGCNLAQHTEFCCGNFLGFLSDGGVKTKGMEVAGFVRREVLRDKDNCMEKCKTV